MIIVCVIALGYGNVFGIGGCYPNDRPVRGGSPWPKGMESLINVTNRVYGAFDNAEDFFFFSGTAADFTAFLRDYSTIQAIEKHRLILHDGIGEAKLFYEMKGPPCDWELYGCPQSWLKAGALMREGTNSLETVRAAAKDTNYVLEVHLWTGGHIALTEIAIPQNVEVSKGK